MSEQNTHAQIVMAAHQAAAGELLTGAIILPADGPWLIHNVFAQIVSATATAAESVGGYLRIDAATGDLQPNPSPTRFPVWEGGSNLGATIDQTSCPLRLFRTNYVAPGRATLNMIFNHPIATTVAPIVLAGIIYGHTEPTLQPLTFIDTVRLAKTTAANQAIGNITLSEKCTRIVGVCGILSQSGVLTTGEELIGFFNLTSNDIDIVPAQFPFSCVFGAGLGATIAAAPQPPAFFIPVDIPTPAGAILSAFAQFQTAVTNAADVEIFIAYE